MKVEIWNGHNIRFVEKDGEWWAVLADVTRALGLKTFDVRRRLQDDMVSTHNVADTLGRSQEMLVVNEIGIYRTIFQSRKPEATDFQNWTFRVLKTLRQATGLEGFQIFRMLDKQHQREAMERLNEGLRKPVRVDFIKANTIANKAVSNMHGYPRMVKKEAMTPEMLVDRQSLLDDTVELMALNDKFGLGLSISDQIYTRAAGTDRQAG